MVRKNVAEILHNHVTFELEAIDRMYLNAYVPSLQTGAGFVYFVKSQLGARVPSTMMVAPMSQQFVDAIERFVGTEGVDLVTFEKGQRKDDVAQQYLATFDGDEGVLFVGKAQEKASVFRTEKRQDAQGKRYPWVIRSTAIVNHYDVYILDRDFGPLFIKFCSYVPYPAKLCLNAHEWLKRQLTHRGIPFEPLDNGIRSSDAAGRVQRIAATLDAAKSREGRTSREGRSVEAPRRSLGVAGTARGDRHTRNTGDLGRCGWRPRRDAQDGSQGNRARARSRTGS